MSAITIIPEDSIVIIDGAAISDLDMTPFNIPEDIRALQWNGTSGWIETTEPSNVSITVLPEWAESCVALHGQTAAEIEMSIMQGQDAVTAMVAERDHLLSLSDWTQLPDAPTDKAAWAVYRQALRDVPAQAGFPHDVTWPTKP